MNCKPYTAFNKLKFYFHDFTSNAVKPCNSNSHVELQTLYLIPLNSCDNFKSFKISKQLNGHRRAILISHLHHN